MYSPTTPPRGNSGDLAYPDVKFPTVGQTEYVKSPICSNCNMGMWRGFDMTLT